jgi:hypothetical protein
MQPLIHIFCVVIASLIGLAFIAADNPLQNDEAMLNQVLNDWRARQQQSKTIRYKIEGEINWPKDRLDNAFVPGVELKKPSRDHTGPVRLELAFDFEKGLARKEKTSDLPFRDGYFSRHEIRVYEGNRAMVYRAKSEKEKEELQLEREDHTRTLGAFLEGSDYPVLFAHGMIPNANAHIDAKQARLPITRNMFWFVGKTIHENRPCFAIGTNASIPPRAKNAHEFVVDPSQDSSIVKWTISTANMNSVLVLYQAEIHYQQTKHGWLPKDWTATSYLNNGINYSEKLKVKDFEINASLEAKTFQIALRPGLSVYDAQSDQGMVVGPDGRSLLPSR